MKIDKIINNNLIRTFDNNGKEILLMGCGLGFQKKIGDTIDRSKIEKIYAIENKKENLYKNYIIFPVERQAILYILYDLHNKNCNNLQEKTVRLLPVRTVFS